MLLHLENGTCSSIADRSYVTQAGRDCHQAFCYRSVTPGYDFQCPTCETPFSLMSGLLQHIESDYCEENLDDHSPLRAFLDQLRSRFG